MNARHTLESIVILLVLLSLPALVSARAYTVTAAGDRLEFLAQLEKGYVIKLGETAGGIHALAGLSALDAGDASEIRGLDRRGVWTVENNGPAGRNEDTIRSLRAGGQVAYAAPLFSSNGEMVAIIPEIVVRVKAGADAAQVTALCERAGCTIIKRMEFTEQEYLLAVLGPDADAVFAAVDQLSQAPEVEWACPNTAFRPRLCGKPLPAVPAPARQLRIASAQEDPNTPGVFPNDEYFPMQWHLHNTGQSAGTPGADIRAPEAWEITTGDPNIVVAVTGGGVDTHHPDLVRNLVPGYDFYKDDDLPDPGNSREDAHDTMCAGLIAAQGNNGIGIAGVAYNCKIMPIRLGDVMVWVGASEVASSFRWAAKHGADVLSNSWGWGASPIAPIHSAIIDVTTTSIGRGGKGCVVVFGSGNGGQAMTDYPPLYPEVIAVGATDHNDVWWNYSSYGPGLDVVAPSGCNGTSCGALWSTDQTGLGGYSNGNPDPKVLDYAGGFWGTSASCPIAAGVAALILSIEPNLTGDEVRHFLERSAKDLGDVGRDDHYGWGRVDARAALDMVLAKRADLNNDWKVDEQDLALLNAAIDANDLAADIAPAAKRDGVVGANDLGLLTRYLGTVIPELGLVAHWRLDEAEGTVAADSAGRCLDATVMGNAMWQPDGGRIGGTLAFDGQDDRLSTPFVLEPSEGPFSAFAWIEGGAPGQVVFSRVGGANWLMASSSGGVLMTDLKSTGRLGKSLASTTVITDGNWHRVGLSWDGSNRILYVDGIEVARDTQAGLAPWAGGLYIGASSAMAPGTFWKGLIDDVRIYDRIVEP